MKSSSRSQKKGGYEKRRNESSNRMVCPGQQVSMYEVWKELQVHEDSRKVYGAEVFVKNVGEMSK